MLVLSLVPPDETLAVATPASGMVTETADGRFVASLRRPTTSPRMKHETATTMYNQGIFMADDLYRKINEGVIWYCEHRKWGRDPSRSEAYICLGCNAELYIGTDFGTNEMTMVIVARYKDELPVVIGTKRLTSAGLVEVYEENDEEAKAQRGRVEHGDCVDADPMHVTQDDHGPTEHGETEAGRYRIRSPLLPTGDPQEPVDEEVDEGEGPEEED